MRYKIVHKQSSSTVTIALKCSFFLYILQEQKCILMPNEWHEHIYAPYKKNESNDYKKWTWNNQDDEQNENVWKCMVRVEKKGI